MNMSKFKIGETVRRTAGSSHSTPSGFHEAGFVGQIAGFGYKEGPTLIFANGHEGYVEFYELAPETKVTEYRKGDKVRILDNRNGFGDRLSWLENTIGTIVTLEEEIDDVNENQENGDWTAFGVVGADYWVRSDDIELVSRPSEQEPEINWEKELFGEQETETHESAYKIVRYDSEFIGLKISKGYWWGAEDLRELSNHLEILAEYLETGTVDLSEECVDCENEYLRESNERLASANEAKRQRLAKINELSSDEE